MEEINLNLESNDHKNIVLEPSSSSTEKESNIGLDLLINKSKISPSDKSSS